MRTVVAIIIKDGEVISYGTNEHKEPCKRENYPTGEGYELCEDCQYTNHAEYNAIKKSEGDIRGAEMYIFGHYYICEPCKEITKKFGISRLRQEMLL